MMLNIIPSLKLSNQMMFPFFLFFVALGIILKSKNVKLIYILS